MFALCYFVTMWDVTSNWIFSTYTKKKVNSVFYVFSLCILQVVLEPLEWSVWIWTLWHRFLFPTKFPMFFYSSFHISLESQVWCHNVLTKPSPGPHYIKYFTFDTWQTVAKSALSWLYMVENSQNYCIYTDKTQLFASIRQVWSSLCNEVLINEL